MKNCSKGWGLQIKIPNNQINIENIDRIIKCFDEEYGYYDKVLNRLFEKADNSDYDNMFCRVGLLDLLYSTGIQRFNKGGIDTVTRHIMRFSEQIDDVRNVKDRNYQIYDKLKEVEYKDAVSDIGRENRIPVFTSKFLSFTNPEVYPIMDSIVKNVIGIREEAGYEEYCIALDDFIRKKIKPLGKTYSLKDIDKFLWLWGKRNKNENG